MGATGRELGARLDPDDFARVEELFASVVPLDAAARARVLSEQCERDDIRAEVESLLVAHDRFCTEGDDDDQPGEIGVGAEIGAYRLVEKIGAGGMGDVYRAERADGLYSQQVAVKLARATLGHGDERRRFTIERQILASLNHEHIVRLLDGGTTVSGQPFLIMEHVDGVPLIAHCRNRQLPLATRLRLFRMVCRAVQHAHQHAIVHRDLKPANILVTPDGLVKIVDFGVAKLLEGNPRDNVTVTGLAGPMTPNYASPEQLRGLPVTTVSDVYSLGVVLYELVAGVRPYDTAGLTLDRVLDVVVHEAPRRPSLSAATSPLPYAPEHLRGDIDAIVLKAIDKEPADRYGSAGELADDISRFLARDPVLARAPSTAYVLRRLAVRHKRLVALTAVALVAIFAASGVAAWQWRAAARAQARAEQRFRDVRQLANAMIFKIHDAVMPLAGSTPVRRTIVEEAIGYMERLGAEAGDDPALRLELANAHRQIGTILGDPQRANLGDRDGALKQFERAHELLVPLVTDQSPFEVITALVDLHLTMSSLYGDKGDRPRSRALFDEALQRALQYRQRHPDERRAASLVARIRFRAALVAPDAEGVPLWEQTLADYEQLLKDDPNDTESQRNVALVGKYLGGILENTQQPERARLLYARSLELDEKRLEAAPRDPRVQFDAAISFSNAASVAETLGDIETAARLFERSLALRRQIADDDPSNVQALGRLGYLLARVGRFYITRDGRRARDLATEAVKIQQRVFATTNDVNSAMELAFARTDLAEIEASQHSFDAACRAFHEADTYYSSQKARLTGRHIAKAQRAARGAAGCAARH